MCVCAHIDLLYILGILFLCCSKKLDFIGDLMCNPFHGLVSIFLIESFANFCNHYTSKTMTE